MPKIERETLTVNETAQILGISAQAVREQMKAGVLPIGDVYRNSVGNGYRYLIYKDKLYRHIGKISPDIKVEQIKEMLQELLGQMLA